MKLGDMTMRQAFEICSNHSFCVNCPLDKICTWGINFGNLESVDLYKEIIDPTQEAKKVLIDCGIMTENGEIADAYKDIIVKKESQK